MPLKYFGLGLVNKYFTGSTLWADLSHLGMNVETWISQLWYLLGKELHSLRRVAEDYRLVDLKLKKKKKKLNTNAASPSLNSNITIYTVASSPTRVQTRSCHLSAAGQHRKINYRAKNWNNEQLICSFSTDDKCLLTDSNCPQII